MSDDNWIDVAAVKQLVPVNGADRKGSAIYSWLARHQIPRRGENGAQGGSGYRYDKAAIVAARNSTSPKIGAGWVRPEIVAKYLGLHGSGSLTKFAVRHKDVLRRKRAVSAKGGTLWLYRRTDLTPAVKALVRKQRRPKQVARRNLAGQRVGLKAFNAERRALVVSATNGVSRPKINAEVDLVLGVRHLLETHKAGFLRLETFMAELEYLVNRHTNTNHK